MLRHSTPFWSLATSCTSAGYRSVSASVHTRMARAARYLPQTISPGVTGGQLEEELFERRRRAGLAVGGRGAGVGTLQVVESVVGDDLALRDDQRLLADGGDLGKDVGREHDGVLAGERLDQLPHFDD